MKCANSVLIVSLVFMLSTGCRSPIPPAEKTTHTEPEQANADALTGVPKDPSVAGYLDLHKRHPDGDEGPSEFVKAYTASAALQRIEQLIGFLQSFATLTERVRENLSEAELEGIGNTEADMQSIGFHNIPLLVEGTILKQDYQLKQAQYELSRLKYDRALISAEELASARGAYEEATKLFQAFWDTKLPTD